LLPVSQTIPNAQSVSNAYTHAILNPLHREMFTDAEAASYTSAASLTSIA
jgi:hypothetical protein